MNLTPIVYDHRYVERFEDFPPQGSSPVYESRDFEEIYSLMEQANRLERDYQFELAYRPEQACQSSNRQQASTIQENIIRKFTKCPELSRRHFKVFFNDHAQETFFKVTSFCHFACQFKVERVVDWFIHQFPGLTPFENDQLESPLLYMIRTSPTHEDPFHNYTPCSVLEARKEARIAGKLSNTVHYEIHKGAYSKNKIKLLNELTGIILPVVSIIFEYSDPASNVDQVTRNGKEVDSVSIPIIKACISGKPFVVEAILDSYAEREKNIRTTLLNELTGIRLSIVSIIYEYLPLQASNAASLTLPPLHVEPTYQTVSPTSEALLFSDIFIGPLQCALTKYKNEESQYHVYIEIAKLLLKYNESLLNLPYRIGLTSKPISIQVYAKNCSSLFFNFLKKNS